jgi:hypothetical protein
VTDRGSTKHSPRVDEELRKETNSLLQGSPVEAHAEEWKKMEPAADGEPNPDARVSVDEIEQRSMLAMSLRPSAFPGDRARLLEVANEEHAEDQVIAWLEALPESIVFATVEEAWEALGGRYERRDESLLPNEEFASAPEPEPAPPPPPAPAPAATKPTQTTRTEPEAPRRETPAPREPSPIERVLGMAASGVGLVIGATTGVVRAVRRLL